MALDHETVAALLGEWLPRQRWFGGKGRPQSSLSIVTETALREGDPALHHVIVAVDYADGERELYQLLLGVRHTPSERLEHALVGMPADGILYDGVHDAELTSVLLDNIARGETVNGLEFHHTDAGLDPSLTSRVLGHEQSNTSLVYGDNYILKLFRKLAPGINPDLEITRALSEAGSTHVARPLGWIEGRLGDEPLTLGLMQEFLQFGTDGWAMANISVRDLYAEGDLHADEVGGDFAAESERLGHATAEVHRDLATAFGTGVLDRSALELLARRMRQRLAEASDAVEELRPHAEALSAAFDSVGRLTDPVVVQRIHGDYHLGQVLRVSTGWVLLDFEGEPARPLAERRELYSVLRDIAGMLRSFDYAARHQLMDHRGEANLEYRAHEWAERNRTAFLDGYAAASGRDPRDEEALLRAFELDKAVYEVLYEARNRPSWLPIPLRTIERLAGSVS